MRNIAVLTLLAAAMLGDSLLLAQEPPRRPAGVAHITITTSRETTFINEPLKADGTVDYVAALDADRRKGVTADNNAAVPLIRAVNFLEPGSEARIYKQLGMAPPADDSIRFVELDSFVPKGPAATGDPNQLAQQQAGQLAKAISAPWTSEQLPLIDEWLAANGQPLNQIQVAVSRARFYVPLVYSTDPPGVADGKLPRLSVLNSAALALRARAMHRLGEGDNDRAAAEVRAIHRLARLVSQGNLVKERVGGGSIEAIACQADCLLAGSKKLSPKTCRMSLVGLSAMSAMPSMLEPVDRTERFLALDSATFCARGNMAAFARKFLGDDLASAGQEPQIDWDLILRMQNAWYDRAVGILKLNDPVKRRAAAQEFAADLDRLKAWRKSDGPARMRELAGKETLADSDLRTEKSETFGKLLVATFMTNLAGLLQFQDETATALDLARVVMALEVAKADLGHYPDTLDDLSPRFIAAVPKDRFSGKPLGYRLDPKGYTLYSVGLNLKDDGGRSKSDGGDPPGDDLVIHMD